MRGWAARRGRRALPDGDDRLTGLDPDLWFYRNSSGSVEVDLLIEEGGALYPREIKSATTFSERMRSHFDAVAALSDDIREPLVVYAGKTQEGVAANFADTSRWCV